MVYIDRYGRLIYDNAGMQSTIDGIDDEGYYIITLLWF